MGGARFCFLTKNTTAVGQWSPLGHFPCINDVVRVASGRRLRLASHQYSRCPVSSPSLGLMPQGDDTDGEPRFGAKPAAHASRDGTATEPEWRGVSSFSSTPSLLGWFAGVFPKFTASARPTERPPEDDSPYSKAATNAKCDGTSRVAR